MIDAPPTSSIPAPGAAPADSPHAALDLLLAHAAPISAERLSLAAATGRVLAEPLIADRPSPACDVSAMDGFAMRLADGVAPRIPIAGEARIGHSPPPLPPRAAIRIVTGAPIPPGADMVVKREDVDELDGALSILDPRALRLGANIRREGENRSAGSRILEPGTPISPAVAGALATFGHVTPLVHRRVRVAILTTGDELVPPEGSPTRWQIRNSNGAALAALLAHAPWIDATPPVQVPDDPDSLRKSVLAALAVCHALVLTGGVSMGDHDHVPAMLASLGARILFHKVPQRPGKPLLGAVSGGGQPILALPGNPVSVLVTARRFGMPVLRRLAGHAAPPPPFLVMLDSPDDKRIDLWWHRLVRRTAPGYAALIDARGSGDIPAAAVADGFVEIPPGQSGPGPWPFFSWAD